jgi:hypothetical protein
MPPLITVLMPVHNGETHLAEAMQSILRQSLRDFEFLIIDDASTDDSVSIIEDFKDSRIRLIQSPARLKLSGALNLGLDHAQGRYIARMDADDISLPHRLEIQASFMEQHPELGLCGTWIRYFGGSSHAILKRPLHHEEILAFTLLDTPFAHPTMMLRRDMLERDKLRFNGDFFPTEDFELWTRALRTLPGANLPEVLLLYRIHGKSLTGADWSTMDEQALRIIQTQLLSLGLTPSPDELRFHRQLAMGRLDMTAAILEQAEVWLTRLIDVNQSARTFAPDALESILGDVWFRTCMHSAKLGFWVATRYHQSSLGTRDKQRTQHEWLMRLAALKAKLS